MRTREHHRRYAVLSLAAPAVALAACVVALFALRAGPAWAAGMTVESAADAVAEDGECTLREAITNANGNDQSGSADCPAGTGADTITFAKRVQTITLSSTLPFLTDPAGLTVDGGGDVTVSGGDAVRIMLVLPDASLALEDITLSDGQTDGGFGAALRNVVGTVTLTRSTVTGNSVDDFGGAISNAGVLNVVDSTFSGNSAGINGGAIDNSGVTGGLTVQNSTFSGNSAGRSGGALSTTTNAATVTNTTFSGNSADEGGGAVYVVGAAVLTLGATVLADSQGGNCAVADGSAPISDGGYNVSDDASCSFAPGSGSLAETDPLLDPLQDNGGPTETFALREGSPAADLVDTGCPPPVTDQRGAERPQDGDDDGTAFCDSGSFELEGAPDERGCDIRGTDRADTLRGTAADETICGLGGNDRIVGGGGADELRGNAGGDKLDSRDGVRGNDTLVGGRGTDACRANEGDRKVNCERP